MREHVCWAERRDVIIPFRFCWRGSETRQFHYQHHSKHIYKIYVSIYERVNEDWVLRMENEWKTRRAHEVLFRNSCGRASSTLGEDEFLMYITLISRRFDSSTCWNTKKNHFFLHHAKRVKSGLFDCRCMSLQCHFSNCAANKSAQWYFVAQVRWSSKWQTVNILYIKSKQTTCQTTK